MLSRKLFGPTYVPIGTHILIHITRENIYFLQLQLHLLPTCTGQVIDSPFPSAIRCNIHCIKDPDIIFEVYLHSSTIRTEVWLQPIHSAFNTAHTYIY